MTINAMRLITGDGASSGPAVAVGMGVVAVLVGIDVGRKKAFRLKLQAQQILCQRQIEVNTRAREQPLAATQP